MKSLSRVQLFATPWTVALPGSSVHGIFQARILEWVAISSSRKSSQPRDWTQVSRIVGRRFTIWALREVQMMKFLLKFPKTKEAVSLHIVAVIQWPSRVRLFCNPEDHSPSGSSVHWISQARILEWVAISRTKDPVRISCIARLIIYHWTTWEDLPAHYTLSKPLLKERRQDWFYPINSRPGPLTCIHV